MDETQDEAALAEHLAARFAKFHPETACRLRARAESYHHRPLVDGRPTAAVTVTPAGSRPDGHDAAGGAGS